MAGVDTWKQWKEQSSAAVGQALLGMFPEPQDLDENKRNQYDAAVKVNTCLTIPDMVLAVNGQHFPAEQEGGKGGKGKGKGKKGRGKKGRPTGPTGPPPRDLKIVLKYHSIAKDAGEAIDGILAPALQERADPGIMRIKLEKPRRQDYAQ